MVYPRLNMLCRWVVHQAPTENNATNTFYLNRARSGIVLSLQALGLPKHSKVGMMIYNCDTVMNAIASAGHEVVFIDVTPELTIDMEHLAVRANDMKVLIVTHLFGIINDIAAIRRQFPHLIIIEDCAHAMGCDCGKEGECAVYSIGQGKFLSVGEGGILQVNNPIYRDKIAAQVHALPQVRWNVQIRQYIQSNIIGLLSKPIVYTLFTRRIKSSTPRKADTTPIVPLRMSHLVRGWYEIEKPYVAKYVEQQLRNVTIWKEYLRKRGIVCRFLDTKNGFMLPVLSDTQLPTFVGIETATHFAQCTAWARTFGYKGDCPCAEELVHHLTMLPCYYTLTEKQLKRQLYGK